MSNRIVLSIAGVAALAGSAVFAADHNTEEMLVTAARTPLELSRVASATTVIDSDDLERRQSRYVTDFLRSVPGFAVSRSGVEGAFTEVRVRGSEANQVLVLIDGVRVNDPALSDSFRWEQLTTANVERIEIVRGPQSALWGTDAVGAVVNIISKPGSDDFSADGFLEAGSDDVLSGGFSSRFSLGKVKLNAAFERITTGGESIARDGVEKDDSDNNTYSLGAALDVNDDVSLDFRVRAVEAYSQFDETEFGTGFPVDSDSANDNETLSARTQLKLNALDDQITHTLAIDWYQSENTNLAAGIATNTAESDRLTLSLQSDIQLDRDILSVAVEREDTDFEQSFLTEKQSIDVTSAVVDYQGLSSEQLSWFLSARYDDNSDFDDAWTGRAAVAYALSDATQLRASVGSARKNPTFTERFGFFPTTFVGNPDLKPERSVSYELGLGQSLFDDAVDLQLSWYRQDLKDEINGFVPLGGGLATAENLDGKSERRGVEASASWAISEQIDLSASYTYLDANEELTPGAEEPEVRRPRHVGSVQGAYRSSDGRFDTTLTADYSGTRTDLFFPPVPPFVETVQLGTYWLVDLTAQYQVTDALTLVVRGQNLLDEDYEEVFGYNTLGRSAYVGFRASIGN